jgi:F0F1-type ATP synthase assembly protein I
MFNNNRFKDTVHPKHRFLSFISQRKKVFTYTAVCLFISTAVYGALHYSLGWLAAVTATSLPLFIIAFQAINFHHYVVDAVIWKVRRKPIQQNLGIETA